MPAIEIVNVHVHLSDTLEHEKAVFPRPGVPDEWYVGNPENVIPFMDTKGISYTFAINRMATNRMLAGRLARLPEEQRKGAEEELKQDLVGRLKAFNTWVCEYHRQEPRIIPFVNVDIGVFWDKQVMMDELEEKVQMGARGVKIHPGGGHFFPGDKRMFPLYERCQEAGLVILADSGPIWPTPEVPGAHGEPVHFLPVFEQFPSLQFIMAHLCSAYWDERIEIAQRFPQVLFDSSGGFFSRDFYPRDGHRACPLEDAPRLLRKVGVERVMFGTDGAGDDVEAQAAQVLGLKLTDSEKEQILAKNAKALLGLE